MFKACLIFKSIEMKKYYASFFFLFVTRILLAATGPKVSYTVSPLKSGDYHSFLIKMTLKGSPAGLTTLSVPYETGQYHPQENLAIINVSNCKKHSSSREDSSVYVIEHTPNAELTLTYTIKNALRDSLPAGDEVYAQMLTVKYFYCIGSALWVVPLDSSGVHYDISLQWKDFPADWTYLNSYGADKASQTISAIPGDFQNAIYMGGDIRIHKLVINEKPLYFGIRGQWSFSDQRVFDIIEKTVRSQRAYWNDYDVDHYTITMIPMMYHSETERSINGRGLTNTFVTVGTNSKALVLEDLLYLFNHELMHHWFGHVLKQGEPETAFKWFHEGFTDYFAHIVMLEGGLLNQQEFKRKVNTIFAAYYSDSTHQWPNEKLQQEYWSSAEIQKLPYQRGLIFAFYLDESIRSSSGGKSILKDIIQQMLTEARQNKNVFSQERLLQLLKNNTGSDYSHLLERFITDGNFISMTDWESVSSNVALLPTDVFDPGFTTDRGIAMNAKIVAVNDGASVQKAGLRIGDIMVGYSATQQPSDSATIVVKRGEEKIELHFLPARQILVPQVK